MLPRDDAAVEQTRRDRLEPASVPTRVRERPPQPVTPGANGVAARTGIPPLPPALAAGPDAKALLQALGRRWLTAASIGILLATAAGLAAWFLLAPKYTAFAQLHVNSTPPWLVFRNPDEGRGEFLTYQKTQAARIRGRFVLNAALNRDEVKKLRLVQEQSEPITWLEDELKVEAQEGSEIITLALSGPYPGELVTLVNAVTQSYLQEIVNVERKRRSDRLVELEDIYIKSNEKLRRKREDWRETAKRLGTSDSMALTQKQVNLLNEFADVKKQLTQVQFDFMKAQGRLEAHRAREQLLKDLVVPETALNEGLEADLLAKKYIARIAQLQEVVTEGEQHAVRKDEGTLVRARQRLETERKSLDSRREEVRTRLTERLRQAARVDYEMTRMQLQNDIAPLTEQEKALRGRAEILAAQAEKIGNSSTELEMLRAEINREDKAANQVGDEREKLQIELRSPPRVSMYQEGALQKRDWKRQILLTVLAPVAALFLVCFGVAWWEFRSRRIHTTEEVVRGLGMRLVGAVPALAHPSSPGHVSANGKQDPSEAGMLESIDSIRTLLLRDAGTRIVMVTSAVGGEGKTTLASHLAGSLARAGRRTLLIDCDLRRPAAHQMFELPLQPGFSEALLGEVHVAEATRSTAVNDLFVIPAGQWDRAVLQVLARDGAEPLFEKLKAEYDFIVVDSHPVLAATDSLLIGQSVDAVLLSILQEVSQSPRVYAASQKLAALGIRVVGAVVNGASREDLYSGGYQCVPEPVR